MVKTFKINNQNKQIKIYEILSIEKNILDYFYKKNFKNKFGFISKNWKWLYRIDFRKKISSLAIFFNKKMIGHSGVIPFQFLVDKKRYLASWFVDFIILPKFQKYGYGTKLAKNWEKRTKIGFTFCNKRSLKIFKKNNWEINNKFYMFFLLIQPFNHLKCTKLLSKRVKIKLNKLFFYFFSKLNIFDKKKLIFLFPELKNINFFIKEDPINFSPIRNKSFFRWRILQSPYFNQYKLVTFTNKKYFLLIKLNNSKKSKYIETLFHSKDIEFKYLRNLLLNLSQWAYVNNYSYIKILLDENKIKRLNLFIVAKRNLNFAFYTKDISIKKKLQKNSFQFQLIDSDFEFLRSFK